MVVRIGVRQRENWYPCKAGLIANKLLYCANQPCKLAGHSQGGHREEVEVPLR